MSNAGKIKTVIGVLFLWGLCMSALYIHTYSTMLDVFSMHQMEQRDHDRLLIELTSQVKHLQQRNEATETSKHTVDKVILENESLRKTVKTLSQRGNYPRNYGSYQRLDVSGYKATDVGVWRVSFYTPSVDECGSNNGITSSGKPVVAGYSAACDASFWKMGSKFYVEGWGIVEMTDTGGSINTPRRMDICIFDRTNALSLGVGNRRVWLLEPESNT